jgi:hypothetical protein
MFASRRGSVSFFVIFISGETYREKSTRIILAALKLCRMK